MRPSIPFKKNTSNLHHFRQSSQKKPFKSNQERISSMLQLLHVHGKQAFNDVSQQIIVPDKSKTTKQRVNQFVQKQLNGLRQTVKEYCLKSHQNFLQHKKLQKLMAEQKEWMEISLRQEDVMKLLFERIKDFYKFSDIENYQKIRIKKLQFLSSAENSIRNSQKKEIAATIEDTNQTEIMNYIQVKNQKFINHNNPVLKINPNSTTRRKLYSPNLTNSLPISCSSTVSQILYKEAKTKNFAQFHQFCQKILLQKKPVISEINLFKNQQLQKTNNYLNQIYKKLHFLNTQLQNLAFSGEVGLVKKQTKHSEIQRKNIGQEIDYICGILKKINQIHNIDSIFFTCQRPCCQYQSPSNAVQSKAKILMSLKQAAKKSIHYKTQVTQNYFNRYYNHDKFDMNRVYSLAKTKNEQMMNLQKTYLRSKEKSKPCKKRCKSLYQNFDSF